MDEEAMTPLHVCPEPKQCGSASGSESGTVAADAATDDDPALAYALHSISLFTAIISLT